MNNIDDILIKHFVGDASKEEETLIERWKSQNSEEYDLLKKAWNLDHKSAPENINFNTAKAWDTVYKQAIQPTRVIPLFKRSVIKYGMAAALVLIIGLIVFLKSGPGLSKEENILVFENTNDSVKSVILPDGSTVWMNHNSKLVYEAGMTNERKMSLSGEAFFDVKRDTLHPFVIACKHTIVSVLGTSFNVSSEDSATVVSVKTGLVKLSSSSSSILLKEGERGFAKATGLSEVLKTEVNYLSWKTGEFVFENIPLTEIVHSLNRYYKNRFETDYINCRITAHFKNSSVEDIVQTVSLICSCKIEYQSDKILFR